MQELGLGLTLMMQEVKLLKSQLSFTQLIVVSRVTAAVSPYCKPTRWFFKIKEDA